MIITTLLGCCTIFISCGDNSSSGDKQQLVYNADKIVDFDDASKVSANGMTASTENIKTSANVGKWEIKKSNNSSKKLSITLDKTDKGVV